jgi:hypothetical protein
MHTWVKVLTVTFGVYILLRWLYLEWNRDELIKSYDATKVTITAADPDDSCQEVWRLVVVADSNTRNIQINDLPTIKIDGRVYIGNPGESDDRATAD